MRFISYNERELINFGKAQKISEGNILLLNGPMGSGKTTFLKGLTFNLGINYISSPTYSIINHYKTKYSYDFFHMDLYKLTSLDEFYSIAGFDILNDEKSIIAIEWPDILKNVLPKERVITFDFKINGDLREVIIL